MIFTILNINFQIFAIITIIAVQILTLCGRRKRGPRPKKSKFPHSQTRNSPDIVPIKASSSSSSHKQKEDEEKAILDETQDVDHYAEAQADKFANVHLLGPALSGSCNDDNAATEAMNRHTTNQFFPQYEIQKLSIKNNMTQAELKKLVSSLPHHPPVRFRDKAPEYNAKIDKERREKWKNVKVTWNPIGPVYIVRSVDLSRSKDEGAPDTVDSPESMTPEGLDAKSDNELINSEMQMSDNTKATSHSRASKIKGSQGGKIFVMTPSTQQASNNPSERLSAEKDKEKEKKTKKGEKSLPEKSTQMSVDCGDGPTPVGKTPKVGRGPDS